MELCFDGLSRILVFLYCGGESTTTPGESTTSTPSVDCPGGSLTACLGSACSAYTDAVYAACAGTCSDRCPTATPTTSPTNAASSAQCAEWCESEYEDVEKRCTNQDCTSCGGCTSSTPVAVGTTEGHPRTFCEIGYEINDTSLCETAASRAGMSFNAQS